MKRGNHRDSCPFHAHVTCVYLCFPNSKLVVYDLIYLEWKYTRFRFGIVVVVLIGKPPLMGEVLCSIENSLFLIIDHIHAKINLVFRAARSARM